MNISILHGFISLFWLTAIGGWIANIVKIFGSSFDPLTAIVVLRCIGIIVAPLGAVLGFI